MTDKPNIFLDTAKAATLFGNSPLALPENSLFSTKKEQEKPSKSQASQCTDKNKKKEGVNPFLSQSKPSGLPSILNIPPNTSNMFAINKKSTESSGTEDKKVPTQNFFAQGDTKPPINPFVGSSLNIFGKKTEQQSINQHQKIQSFPSNQSNIFSKETNDPAKNNFSLFQMNQESSNSEANNQGKSIFGQPSKSLFGTSENAPKTGGLFSLKNESQSGGLFSSIKNLSIKGGLFGNTDTKEPSKDLFGTKDTLQSSTFEKQELAKSSQESQEEPIIEQKQQFQQNQREFPSIVHEEKSQEDKSSEKQFREEQSNQLKIKAKEIINFLQMKKKIQQQGLILFGYSEFQRRQKNMLKTNLYVERKKNEELGQKIQTFQAERTQKQEKLIQIKTRLTNELSYKQIAKASQENNPTKSYPDKDSIQKDIKHLTKSLQSYYAHPSDCEETSNPQTELRSLVKKINDGFTKKDHLLREQKPLITTNAQTLRKIQSTQMFGKYTQVMSELEEREKAEFGEIKQNLQKELKRLKEENANKKQKFEAKKTQLREYSPPQKIAEGRSSIIMRSIIHD